MVRKPTFALLSFALCGVIVLCGCGGGNSSAPGAQRAYTPSAVITWDNAALQAIRVAKPGPPMVARALAIVHTSIYDAWAAYDPVAVGTQLGGSLRRPAVERTLANKQKAVSYAAYRALLDLFPAQSGYFQSVLTGLGYDPNDANTDRSTPSGIGNVAAAAVLAFRHHDGSNQLGDLHPGAYSDYTGYTPVNTPDQIVDPNSWQPLRVPNGQGGATVQKFVGAQWFKVVPFALTSPAQFRPAAPPRYPSAEYADETAEILDISANLTPTQKMIAEYWADGPGTYFPPGHWCAIAQFVSARDRQGLDADVKLFFIVGNAVFDAGVAAWDAKCAYNSERPITAIHYLYNGKLVEAWGGPGQGAKLIHGEAWQPYQPANVVTPAFPEYISGHSTFSAAAAEALRRFTGRDNYGASLTVPVGSSQVETGMPQQPVSLSWPTFSAAADQAGMSRRYGGIHFRSGDLEGRQIGRQVGAAVWQKAMQYIGGTAG